MVFEVIYLVFEIESVFLVVLFVFECGKLGGIKLVYEVSDEIGLR